MQTTKKVHFVSLGCPKNRVDSEVMLGHLARAGYTVTSSAEEADLLVVNTCAFIQAAKEESVEAIVEMAQHKQAGQPKKLVVAGCLSQRYAPQLAAELPEVDHFVGTGNFEEIAHLLKGPSSSPSTGKKRARLPIVATPAPVVLPDPDFTLSAASPRLLSQGGFSTYLKISEGCSNRCAFCIIPQLRGPQRSRPLADVVAEAEKLIDAGAVEINLVAQDLCAYGKDRTPRENLAQLLRALDQLGRGLKRPLWIRCLYAYPKGLTRDVIAALANAEHIVPYLDMPLQHISDKLLRSMRRGAGGEATRQLLQRLRRAISGLTLRTTFITGLPGETAADFAELCDFVQEMRFNHLGVFAYSPEEDTPAAAMAQQVPAEVAEARRTTLMALQAKISAELQAQFIGQSLEVLVEGVAQETDLLLQGRHAGQAPEIDGLTYINSGTATPGEVVRVRIEEAGQYDIVGGIVEGATSAA